MARTRSAGKKEAISRVKKQSESPKVKGDLDEDVETVEESEEHEEEPEEPVEPEPARKREHLWIYNKERSSGWYEFHDSFQDHLEKSFKARKRIVRLMVFGSIYNVDVIKKKRVAQDTGFSTGVKRIRNIPSALKKNYVVGVSDRKYGDLFDPDILDDDDVRPDVQLDTTDDNVCVICFYPMHMPLKINCGHYFCFSCIKAARVHSRHCPLCRRDVGDHLLNPCIMNDIQMETTLPESFYTDCDSGYPPVKLPKSSRLMNKMTAGKVDTNREDAVQNAPGSICEAPDVTFPDKKQQFFWIYEDSALDNFWWRYDPRIERLMENEYVRKKASAAVNIPASPATINFKTMQQIYWKNNYGHETRIVRRVKRIPVNFDREKIRVRGVAGAFCGHYILPDLPASN